MSLPESHAGIPTITPQQLQEKIESGEAIDLIDVRTKSEYKGLHAAPAQVVPLDDLTPYAVDQVRTTPKDRPLFLICRSGVRSEKGCMKLLRAGYPNVVSVAGGTLAWEQAGLPIVRGTRQILPLDRQVQLAAGSMNLAGVLLGWFSNPNWYLLSGFIGLGLIFAGSTGICPLGWVIAKMPWNQARVDSASCCSR
ncbi:rhodanese-like domain-containing protein [Aquisphaera insulae]|uniref:rhodanese-like domain-containing protein n=1 Tax=Aquisphaera insulae TaxID=2712864 RepID=UPI0013EC1B3A|nr:rhodanese-like domain-containing protein [Aquisphaera insulae]